MTWLDVMVFSGIAFVIGCCVGCMIEILRRGQKIDEIRRLHREGKKIHEELQDAMMEQIENYKNYTEHQRVYIEKLIEYINKPNE